MTQIFAIAGLPLPPNYFSIGRFDNPGEAVRKGMRFAVRWRRQPGRRRTAVPGNHAATLF